MANEKAGKNEMRQKREGHMTAKMDKKAWVDYTDAKVNNNLSNVSGIFHCTLHLHDCRPGISFRVKNPLIVFVLSQCSNAGLRKTKFEDASTAIVICLIGLYWRIKIKKKHI